MSISNQGTGTMRLKNGETELTKHPSLHFRVLSAIFISLLSLGSSASSVSEHLEDSRFTSSYTVLAEHPHDQDSFTQGLERVGYFSHIFLAAQRQTLNFSR